MAAAGLACAVMAGCGDSSSPATEQPAPETPEPVSVSEPEAPTPEQAVEVQTPEPAPVSAPAPVSEPPVSQASAGPAPVHQADELAAHPSDPDRMAKGVVMEDIIPRLALTACEQAVAAYPDEARFRYQLGRALEASGRQAEAFAAFEQAAGMGHRMAHYNLGIAYANGQGTPADAAKAREQFNKAMELGVSAAGEWMAYYVFSSEGFSHPAFFQAIYEGNYADINADPTDMATYLTTFIEPFTKTEGCGMVISRASFTKMSQHAQMAVLGKMLGSMANARNDHASGDFVGAGVAGYRAGEKFNVDIAAMVDKGHDDAQLFYERYGCDSPIAQTFFQNVETYANKLGSASFTKEIEKNYQR
jgi:hypothetical protein